MTVQKNMKQNKTNFLSFYRFAQQKQFCATVMQPLNIQQFNVSQKHFCTTVMQPANKTFVWEHLAENVQSQQLSKSVFTNFSLISF